MRKNVALLVFLFCAVGAVFLGASLRCQGYGGRGSAGGAFSPKGPAGNPLEPGPGRIVSLAPSITETVFALGQGKRLAGVTRFCECPPGSGEKVRVGGYSDPSLESILALEPDLVLLQSEHEKTAKRLASLNIPVRVVDQKDIPGILESVHAVAKFLKVPGRARSIVKSIRGRMDRVTRAVSNRPRPRVMLSLGRNMGSASLDRVYLAGRYGLYHEMIRLCGGANAYRGGLAFPCVSREGILRLDPEVIIELIPEIEDSDTRIGEAREAWNAFKEVEAVQNGRVYVMGRRDVLVPGPGFIDVCERMARMIHPEVEW